MPGGGATRAAAAHNGAPWAKKKPRSAGLQVMRGNGGVLFRDYSGYANWRSPHPVDEYTPKISFVK
jgi:hypothetical protein